MATATQPAHKEELDPRLRSSTSRRFEDALREKIVGQNEAVQALVELHQVFCAGLRSPRRPVGNLLFLGPTGSGKTRIVEAAAEILFGDTRAVIKVDCAEFQHSHEIAKLIGSPPGYLGHRETHPMITQEALATSHTDKLKLSFLLFDEIEKANDSLWQLLLGMLDKATLTLGDNRRVDLSQTVIFLTSNLGAGEISELMQGGMGFIQPKDKPVTDLDQKVERTAVEAARRKFSPEFMNRLDAVVVFHPLKYDELKEVLDIELGQVQTRISDSKAHPFLFRMTNKGRQFLLEEGTDQLYGARHLKRAIERYLVGPLARLLATEQVHPGDVLVVDRHPGEKGLAFRRDTELRISSTQVPQAASYFDAPCGCRSLRLSQCRGPRFWEPGKSTLSLRPETRVLTGADSGLPCRLGWEFSSLFPQLAPRPEPVRQRILEALIENPQWKSVTRAVGIGTGCTNPAMIARP